MYTHHINYINYTNYSRAKLLLSHAVITLSTMFQGCVQTNNIKLY